MRVLTVPSLLLFVSAGGCAGAPSSTSDDGRPNDDTSMSDDDDDDDDGDGDDDDDDDDDDANSTGGRETAGSDAETGQHPDSTTTQSGESTLGDDVGSTSTTSTTTEGVPEPVAVTPIEEGNTIVFAGPRHRLVIESEGARVIEYSLDGANVLNTASNRLQHGSTFWVAPQSAWMASDTWSGWPPPAELDDDAYSHVIQNDEVVFSSPDIAPFGVSVQKTFAMMSDGAVVLRYSMTALAAVEWAPWEISRLPPALCFFGPGQETNTWEYSNYATPVSPEVVDGVAWLPPYDNGNGELLADSTGWAGCAIESSRLLFLKQYPDVAASGFAAGNGDLKIWWQNDAQGEAGFRPFLELEPIGARVPLQPGAMTSYEVSWTLSEIPEDVQIASGSTSLAALFPSP